MKQVVTRFQEIRIRLNHSAMSSSEPFGFIPAASQPLSHSEDEITLQKTGCFSIFCTGTAARTGFGS